MLDSVLRQTPQQLQALPDILKKNGVAGICRKDKPVY